MTIMRRCVASIEGGRDLYRGGVVPEGVGHLAAVPLPSERPPGSRGRIRSEVAPNPGEGSAQASSTVDKPGDVVGVFVGFRDVAGAVLGDADRLTLRPGYRTDDLTALARRVAGVAP
jgi:hypothetical protein